MAKAKRKYEEGGRTENRNSCRSRIKEKTKGGFGQNENLFVVSRSCQWLKKSITKGGRERKYRAPHRLPREK